MTSDLSAQTHHLFTEVDRLQASIDVAEILSLAEDETGLEGQVSVPRIEPSRLRRRVPGWAYALAAAAATLLLVGGSAWLFGLGDEVVADDPLPITTVPLPDATAPAPSTTLEPGDNSSETTLAPLGPDFSPSDLGEGWTKVAGVELLGSTGVDRGVIVVGGPGLVASGEACDKPTPSQGTEGSSTGTVCGPIVVTSVDGRDWSRVADDPFGTGLINDLVAYGTGVVAVGSACNMSLPPGEDGEEVSGDCAPAVWVSSDGLSWTRIADETVFASCVDCGSAEIDNVAVAGTRIVAVGNNQAWFSDDGMTWQLSRTEEAFAGTSGPYHVAASGSGFIAWGFGCGNVIENGEVVGFDCSTATWTSEDGADWERQTPGYGSVAVVEDHTSLGSTGVGVGLVSEESGELAAAWYSLDGVSWTTAQVEDEAAGIMRRVISSGTWLVAFSGELPEGRTVIWVSNDGQNWSRAPIDPPELATTHVTSATFTPSGIVVLGRDFSGNERAIWIWASPSP